MNEDLLRKAYQAFNARDIDAVLVVLHPNVDWANCFLANSVRTQIVVEAIASSPA